MAENFSKIDIEVTENDFGVTPYAGLIPFMQMCEAMRLPEVIDQNLQVRSCKGYRDSEHILSIIAMQIAGGSTLSDLAVFKEKLNLKGFPFGIPSPSATREYMSHFHNEKEEEKQKQGKVYIPEENEHYSGFEALHNHIFQTVYNMEPKRVITLDQDATFIYTSSRNALYNYHGEKSYEAFNTYCPEYDILVGTQFRDGNVNPGYGQVEELRRVLSNLPEGIEKVRLRSDSAGYQVELLKYCCDEEKRFGAIDFTISCPVGKDFKEAAKAVPEGDWKPLMKKVKSEGSTKLEATCQEYADVVYVPQWAGNSKKSPEYRFIAIRERFEEEKGSAGQQLIPEMVKELEAENENMKKLHLTVLQNVVYKIFGLVTNRVEADGGELILWHYGRCGKSEEIHRILKDELAGGHVASRKFGACGAWWNIAVVTLSLLNAFNVSSRSKSALKSGE